MANKLCVACGAPFQPRPQVTHQTYCAEPDRLGGQHAPRPDTDAGFASSDPERFSGSGNSENRFQQALPSNTPNDLIPSLTFPVSELLPNQIHAHALPRSMPQL